MEKGDLSNQFPRRILICLDVIVEEEQETKRILGIVPVQKIHKKFDRMALNRLWNFSSKLGVTLELFDTGMTQDEIDKVFDLLDRTGLNPFRAAVAYDSVGDLVRELPFRPEVLGVVDLPQKAFVYGSKYFDLNRI